MIPYWLLFAFFTLFVFTERGKESAYRKAPLPMVAGGLLIAVMIGLRFDVGGDWESYQIMLRLTRFMSLDVVLERGDPGYYLVNWVVAQLGLEIWAVNLFCGIAFATGLVTFARTLPQPWLAILVAVPYLVIVVAMGYSRQGVAIGFGMLGLAALHRGSMLRFVFWTAVAATFHKTAVVLLPLAVLASSRGRFFTLVSLTLFAFTLYFLFLDSVLDKMLLDYTSRDSQGAVIRVSMNAVAAILFLAMRRKFLLPPELRNLWTTFSLAALACVPAVFLFSSSTIIDRLALYLIPLQLFVLGSLPLALGHRGEPNRQAQLGVVAYCGIILFVWVNFATHAQFWIPYRFYPLVQNETF